MPLHAVPRVGRRPPGDGATPSSRDSGPHGGNTGYRLVREGPGIDLAVGEEGANLHLRDGHAAWDDGELTGDALGTSMGVVFSVEVRPLLQRPLRRD